MKKKRVDMPPKWTFSPGPVQTTDQVARAAAILGAILARALCKQKYDQKIVESNAEKK